MKLKEKKPGKLLNNTELERIMRRCGVQTISLKSKLWIQNYVRDELTLLISSAASFAELSGKKTIKAEHLQEILNLRRQTRLK